MKGYTSLGSSPSTNYMRFNDNGSGGGGGGGGGGRCAMIGSPGSLGGWADNSAFKRLDNYSTYGKHEKLQEREINRNSEEVNRNGNSHIYTTENIIKLGDNNNNNIMNSNNSFVAGEVVYQTIVIPFYVCLMDIIIFNDLFIEVVDNSSIETKNKVLISGKIRKYRLNGAMKNYDIFIEMENEDVFHVKKRGIMMRVRLSEELRKLIINTMVNYMADGGELDPKSKAGVSGGGNVGSVVRAGSAATASLYINTQDSRSGGGVFSCFGCFKSRNE